MVAHDYLELRVCVVLDEHDLPTSEEAIQHGKLGLVTDSAGDRAAFNGGVNETPHG